MTNEDPGNASILLPPGETGYSTSLEAGTYRIQYSADGYIPEERTIELNNDMVLPSIVLQPEQVAPAMGTLRLTVAPSTVVRTITIAEAESEWCTVTFNANGGSYAPPAERVAKGSRHQLSQYRAAGERMFFTGWQDLDGNWYSPADWVVVNTDMTLNAQWLQFGEAIPEGHPVLSDLVAVDDYIINGSASEYPYQAWWDVNNDGEVDIFDLVYMSQYVADN